MSEPWREAAQHADGGVVLVRDDGTIAWASRRFGAQHGLPAEELAGRTLRELLDADASPRQAAGVSDRGQWEIDLRRELYRARRGSSQISVAMVGFDRADARSSPELGGRGIEMWRAALRASDSIAPYNRSAFAIVLPDCPMDEALQVVTRVREASPESEPVSAGIACWDANETEEHLASRAALALRAAQSAGGDQALFSPRATEADR